MRNPPTIDKLLITISPTADGTGVYVQLLSADAITLNVVVVCNEVDVEDSRSTK